MSTYPYSVEQFAEAYEETGLRPKECEVLDKTGECGCPQGVLAIHLANGGSPKTEAARTNWTVEVLSISYQQFNAFTRGFDIGEEARRPNGGPIEDVDAFAIGLACRKKFLGLG